MDNERDPSKENEEVGRTFEEPLAEASDEEEFEDIDEADDDEDDLES
jgi:hypothetical protein